MSKGTIHNIETQEKPVSIATVYEHFENLGIIKSELPTLVSTTEKELQECEFTLKLIQMLIDGGNIEKGYDELHKIDLPAFHPFASYHSYIQARYYFHQGDWDKAVEAFKNTINHYNKNKYKLKNQIVAHCYNLLGLCSYYKNDIPTALEYAQLGLKHATQSDLKCSIASNRILYLSQSGNNPQAFFLINKLWKEINQANKITTRLNVYLVRTILLRNAKQLNEAIQCAKEGLDLAFLNREYNRAFYLAPKESLRKIP